MWRGHAPSEKKKKRTLTVISSYPTGIGMGGKKKGGPVPIITYELVPSPMVSR